MHAPSIADDDGEAAACMRIRLGLHGKETGKQCIDQYVFVACAMGVRIRLSLLGKETGEHKTYWTVLIRFAVGIYMPPAFRMMTGRLPRACAHAWA